MLKQLVGIALFIVIVVLGSSPSLFAQETQILPPTEVVPGSSTGNVSTLHPPSPGDSLAGRAIAGKRLLTPDPRGLRRWKDFLRDHPDALPTAPGVITQGPPNALLAPTPSGPSGGPSDEARPFLFPDPRGLQPWQDFLRRHPDAILTSPESSTDTAPQLAPDAPLAPSTPSQFGGLSNDDNQTLRGGPAYRDMPPDPNIAVGPGHIFQMVNHVGRIRNRTTGSTQDFTLRTFFGVQRPSESDPRVIYDVGSSDPRWFATYLEFDESVFQSSIILMVSKGSDPTYSTDPLEKFCRYWIGNATFEGYLQDFPQLAVSDKQIVITYNGFYFDTQLFRGVGYYVLDKAYLINNAAGCPQLTSSHRWRHAPNENDGLFTAQPAQSLGSTNDLFMAALPLVPFPPDPVCTTFPCPGTSPVSKVNLLRVTGVPDGSTNSVTVTPTELPIRPLYAPLDALQRDSSSPCSPTCVASNVYLDTGDGRLRSAAWQKNDTWQNPHTYNSLWLAGDEACTPNGDTARSCLRVIEIQIPIAGNPSIRQDITLGGRTEYLYYPALRSDRDGNVSIVFTASSVSAYAGVRITGRLAADPVLLPLLQAVSEIQTGGGTQRDHPPGVGEGRMGDYSGAAVDPTSASPTVWVSGEYIKSTYSDLCSTCSDNWGTWVAQLQALPSLFLTLNQGAFHPGQTLNLNATVTPWPTLPVADVYVAVQLPDNSLLYLLGNGSLSSTQQPYAANWQVSSFSGQIFSYIFNGGEPPGYYAWLSAFATAGSQPPNFIGGIYNAPFTFSNP